MLEEIIKQRMENLELISVLHVDLHIDQINAIAKSLNVKTTKSVTKKEAYRVIEECKTALMDMAIKYRKPDVPTSTLPGVDESVR
jgi:hypothetical protein